jgi:hypothetical protein
MPGNADSTAIGIAEGLTIYVGASTDIGDVVIEIPHGVPASQPPDAPPEWFVKRLSAEHAEALAAALSEQAGKAKRT